MRISSWNRSAPCGDHARVTSTKKSPFDVSNFTRKTSGTTTFGVGFRHAERKSASSTVQAASERQGIAPIVAEWEIREQCITELLSYRAATIGSGPYRCAQYRSRACTTSP